MAHRTNVIQVSENIEFKNGPEKVTDPICRTQLTRKLAKHVLVKTDHTYYFCSKECLNKFMSHQLPQAKAS